MTRVAAGRDFQSKVMGDTASTGTGSYAAANYIAMTANATAPADTDTTLTAEFATGGGGLVRAQAAYAHGAGATTYTLTKTFTMNATDSAGTLTPAKGAIFNAASAGTMLFETAIPSPPAMVAGDQITITETVSI